MSTPAGLPPVHDHGGCAACQILDHADGIVDGKIGTAPIGHVTHERAIVEKLLQAQDRIADKVTGFAGSLRFVYLHSVWFGVWILVNIGLAGASLKFDKFPFGLLTMIVSLEAIFLSTFVMVSQNRQAARADVRSDLDFENNLRGEVWSVHIGASLGIDADHVESVVQAALAQVRGTVAPSSTEPSA